LVPPHAPHCRYQHLATYRAVKRSICGPEIRCQPSVEPPDAVPFQPVEVIPHRIESVIEAQPIDRGSHLFRPRIKLDPTDYSGPKDEDCVLDVLADSLLQSMIADMVLVAKEIVSESEIELGKRRNRSL
jgi:hypothetical protein